MSTPASTSSSSATPPNPTISSSSTSQKKEILDDKSPHCIPFILSLLADHQSTNPTRPLIIALNGIQGSGKSTLVSHLSKILTSPPYSLPTLILSIDDLYLPHLALTSLAASHPQNPLLQHRGEPGTHDIQLATSIFHALKEGEQVAIPEYDKSAHNGKGDRIPSSHWKIANAPPSPHLQILIFEGWCVGFRALSPPALLSRVTQQPSKTLSSHRLEDLLFINEKLEEYEALTKEFDAFVHIDAEETGYVYKWRQEQEEVLRREKGRGMSVQEVERFVDGYYPAYELYTEALREGIFKGEEGKRGRQLRLVVGRDRKVKEVIQI